MTGVDLHESKGVASATVDTVFVADGAGSGIHKKIPNTALSALANPFGAQLLHVREEQPPGTTSQTSGLGSVFLASVLNVVKTNEIVGASLSSSQITLPVGTYFIDASIPYAHNILNGASLFAARLQNLTTSIPLIYSQISRLFLSGTTANRQDTGNVLIRGRFTLAAASVLELQQFKTTYFPVAGSLGTEVYADALIWKLL